MIKVYSILYIILYSISFHVDCQRVPPGVPPQHYQQQQQYQQQVPVQHVQHQQVPMQQQQVPMQQHPQQQQQPQQIPMQQQVPVPVQQQQVPIQQQQQQQHHQQMHHHGQQAQLLNTANIAHEKEHIAEHMEVPIDTSKMSEQELQFHYFKMHDADNNNKLDGCELIKSLIHWHAEGSKEKLFKDEELTHLIDPILQSDDSNRDGYIDYPEFIRAQQKAAHNKPSQ